ncbi:MAG TPA: hypothetical protein VIY86_09795 [Pirellulaceae bacterium]
MLIAMTPHSTSNSPWDDPLAHWRRIPATARRHVLVGAGLLIVALGGFSIHARWRTEPLLAGRQLSEVQLAALESALVDAGLADYRIEDGRIRVRSRDRGRYLRALADADVLPKRLSSEMEPGTAASSPLESQAHRAERHLREKERELATILRAMPVIEDATVRFDEARHLDGPRECRQIRGMVVVQSARKEILLPEALQAIRELVVSRCAGLSTQDVTILDLTTGQSFRGDRAMTPEQLAQCFAHRKATYEAHWTRKVRELLAFLPGASVATEVSLAQATLVPTHVRVSVAVPDSYFERVWRQRQQQSGGAIRPPTPQERAELEGETRGRLETMLAELRPSGPRETDGISIVVTGYASSPDGVGDMTALQSPNATVAAVILLMVVACAVLLVGFLRDVWGGRKDGPERSGNDEDEGSPPRWEASQRSTAANPPRASTLPMAAPEPALAELVRDNPSAAAKTFQSWINPAA